MTVWWDPVANRYRSSLPHKVLYVWCWPAIRLAMVLLPPETAHHLALRGIVVAGWVDRVWGRVTLGGAILVLLVLRALLLLPRVTCEPPEGGKS